MAIMSPIYSIPGETPENYAARLADYEQKLRELQQQVSLQATDYEKLVLARHQARQGELDRREKALVEREADAANRMNAVSAKEQDIALREIGIATREQRQADAQQSLADREASLASAEEACRKASHELSVSKAAHEEEVTRQRAEIEQLRTERDAHHVASNAAMRNAQASVSVREASLNEKHDEVDRLLSQAQESKQRAEVELATKLSEIRTAQDAADQQMAELRRREASMEGREKAVQQKEADVQRQAQECARQLAAASAGNDYLANREARLKRDEARVRLTVETHLLRQNPSITQLEVQTYCDKLLDVAKPLDSPVKSDG